jgi:hypothetical protein
MFILEDRLALLASVPLRSGNHGSVEEGMCAMEAVAFVAGEAHTDTPACACPVIAAFMRRWNDGLPDDARRDLYLKRFIPRLVGSLGPLVVAERRAYLALDWLIRVYTPAWLDLVEATKPYASALRALGEIVDMASAKAAESVVRAAGDAAGGAARAAAGVAAWDAAWDAAGDAARAAAGGAARAAAGVAARDAAWDAAEYAARAAAWAAAEYAAWDAAGVAARVAAGDAVRAAAEYAAWDAAEVAARIAAGDAVRAAAGVALRPTVETLQVSALDLLERMIAAGAR